MKHIIYKANGSVAFKATIDAQENDRESTKKELSLLWAIKNSVDLTDCDLSEISISNQYLENIDFSGCDFTHSNLLNCFFINCDFTIVTFSKSYLTECFFINCKQSYTAFYSANLKDCLMYTPVNQTIPIIKNIHQTVYAAVLREPDDIELEDYADCRIGGLDQSAWHTCSTVHCHAGWVVHLAGKAGYELESKISTEKAAIAIYATSDHDYFKHNKRPDFSTEADPHIILENMKRLADEEAAK